MSLPRRQLWLAVSCLGGAALTLQNAVGLEGTEFSGGWLTGRLLAMADVGAVLFVLALIATFPFPRIAAGVGLASSLLCLPLHLYLVAPAPFAAIFGFGHEFKVRPGAGFHWDPWAIAGLFMLAVATYVCSHGFAAIGRMGAGDR